MRLFFTENSRIFHFSSSFQLSLPLLSVPFIFFFFLRHSFKKISVLLGFFEFDQNILQFYGVWDMTSREHGDALRVRLHYHLSDDTIEGMYNHTPPLDITFFWLLKFSLFKTTLSLSLLSNPI